VDSGGGGNQRLLLSTGFLNTFRQNSGKRRVKKERFQVDEGEINLTEKY